VSVEFVYETGAQRTLGCDEREQPFGDLDLIVKYLRDLFRRPGAGVARDSVCAHAVDQQSLRDTSIPVIEVLHHAGFDAPFGEHSIMQLVCRFLAHLCT
jgi:hypothetical protein